MGSFGRVRGRPLSQTEFCRNLPLAAMPIEMKLICSSSEMRESQSLSTLESLTLLVMN